MDIEKTIWTEEVVNKLNERELFYAQSKFVVEKNNVRVEDILFLL